MFIPSSRFGRQLFLVILCMLNGLIVHAQENEMATDRPDQTEASSVVGKGVFQIETGVVFSKEELEFFNTVGDIKINDYATTLLRYGIRENIELRLITAYTEVRWPTPSIPDDGGLQPLAVGVKIAIAEENGFWPEIAYIGHLTLPWVGSDAFVPTHIGGDFRFSLSHTLSDRFAFGYNLGFDWDGNTSRPAFVYTAALGVAVAGPVSMFVEVFGDDRVTGWYHLADLGFTVLITRNLQFDSSYGFGLNSGNNMHFFNAGLSARFGERYLGE
jgi:hypothetical protein